MSRTRGVLRPLFAAATLAIVGLACTEDGTGPSIPGSLSVIPSDASVPAGQTLQITATLRDSNGGSLPLSGVSWTSSDSRVATVSATGLVTAVGLGGPATITASAGALTARTLVTVVAGPATQVSIVTQPSPSAASGVALSLQPVVRLRDALGNAVSTSGLQVNAVLAVGQGTLANATVATDALGRASFTGLTISGTGGTYRLRFEVTGLTAATSDAIALSPVESLTIDVQPPTVAQSGVIFGVQPEIVVLGAGGAPVAGEPVTVAVASGGGTLSGTATVVTDGSGVATFTDLSLTGLVGNKTLSFSAGPFSVESGAIILEPGEPASIFLVTQPSSAALNGVVFGRQPIVEVRDDGGNPIPGADLTVAVASGGATLGGTTTTVTNANGRVGFTDLSLTGPSGPHTLGFASGSATAPSATITLSVGSPATISVTTQPSPTAQSGVAFPQQPSVNVRDSGGNPVVGVVVTASIASGGGTLGGSPTASTNGSGRATFSGLSVGGPVGDRTLQFTSGSASGTSNAIQLQAGPLAQLVITVQPSASATNAVVFAQQPTASARDASGNTIGSIDVTASILSGGGVLGGTTTVATDGSGTSSFSGLSITGTIGPRTLRFSSGAVNVSSNVVNLAAGAPTSATLVTQPPAFTFSGTVLTRSPVVEVRDVSGNLVSGTGVVASIGSGSGAVGGTTSVNTTGSGAATFSNLSILGSPGPQTLRFTASAAQATSNTVNLSYSAGDYTLTYCGSQLMDVRVPSAAFPRPRPVAVHIHGGGWTSGDRTTGLLLDEVRDELVSRGYVVASLDYRLATASTNQWPAPIHDVKCAIRHLRAQAGDYGADGRIGVWGASSGGHLTAMLGVTDAGAGLEGNEGFPGVSSRVDAAVTIGGISDLTDGPPHDEIGFFGPEWLFASPHTPIWDNPQPQASPITWASSNDPPFLIIHGDKDTTVLPAQATKMFNSLAGANPTLRWVVNGGHNLDDVGMGTPTPDTATLTQQIANFFDAHVF